MAVERLTPNNRISIGVISAPPPAPVIPTSRPTIPLPSTMYGSMCTLSTDLVERGRVVDGEAAREHRCALAGQPAGAEERVEAARWLAAQPGLGAASGTAV